MWIVIIFLVLIIAIFSFGAGYRLDDYIDDMPYPDDDD